MSFNGKHLSLEDRKIIEGNINKGLRKFETAKELNKSQSTIGKEIKNNRKRRYSQVEDVPRKCKYYNECKRHYDCSKSYLHAREKRKRGGINICHL